jgi:phage terminase large subunit-like protein
VPTPEEPIDFATTVEQTILDWHSHFSLQAVLYDPFQMAASAQVLQRHGVVMEEYAQTLPALTAVAENLHSLIKGRNLAVYPNEQIRTAISRSIAVEGSRGWKIAKDKQSHRIDIVIALGMAALAAIRAQGEAYDYSMSWISNEQDQQDSRAYQAQKLYTALNTHLLLQNYGYYGRRFW